MRPALFLLSATLALWIALVIPARMIWGDVAVIQSGSACLLCVLPACGTLIWIVRSRDQRPAQQMAAILGGTGLRMFGVLAAALVLFAAVPPLHEVAFWIWILVFYLFTLALEMALVVRG